MSIQLIVYPQNYNGDYNAISSSPTEFLVNGINFNNLDTTGTYTSSVSVPYVDTLTNAPPTIYNTWYRFRNNTAGTPDYPSVVVGNLVLKTTAGATGSRSGIYQKLSNLTISAQYTITINLSAATTGLILTKIANGTIIYAQGNSSANTTQVTLNFTAQSTDSTVMIVYYNTIIDTATITDISIQPVIGAIPSGATNVLDNGQVLCDLYEDEDIPLSLSVDDFKNVAEKVQSYSKAFNIPETKRNKRIFDNIFEITRHLDAGSPLFNPYKKTQCVLKQDGFILFEGYLRLLDVTDKEGEVSYNVNLYSEVVALADVLGDLTFSDLDFTELEHDYNITQIEVSWNDAPLSGMTYLNPSTSGFRDANSTVKYPFVNWNNNWLIAAIGGTPTAGNPQLVNLEQAFRPFINVRYLIDRIFDNVPFTYESAFFDTDDFKKLYMDFNWGADNAPVVFNSSGSLYRFSEQNIPTSYDTIIFEGLLPSEFGYSSGVFTAQEDGQIYSINFNMDFSTVFPSETLDIEWLINGVANASIYNLNIGSTGNTFNGSFTTAPLSAGDTISCRARSSLGTAYLEANVSNLLNVITSSTQTTNETLLDTLRGETGQWDFLKGLLTMFNLVTLPDEDNPNNIKIEPYSDVFINSTDSVQLNWTDKIDVSEMKLEPLTDLNKKTIFKFVEDDDDFAFTNYKNLVGGHLYGSKKYDAGNEFNILQGEDEVVAEPFAATVVKPLASQFSSFITPALYSYNSEDDTSEGFENSPRIMYNNGIKNSGTTYYIPPQNGVVGSAAETNFLQFSHLSDIPTIASSRDFHFGECQLLTGVGNATANNVFNLYWLPYSSELYNPNTRTMTIKVNLSPADINTFKFNDTVMIKNRVFRVNKIDYKPNDLATVEFILIP